MSVRTIRFIRVVAIGLAASLILGACAASGQRSSIDSTSTSGVPATTEPTGIPAAEGVAAGELCDTPGQLGTTSSGTPLICSGTAIDGTPLDNPTWRATAGDGVGALLTDSERAAVDAVRSSDPQQQPAGDQAILVQIQELGHAAELAAEADLPIDESFVKLLDGYQVANDVDYDTSVTSITALLRAVLILFDDQHPGATYSADLLEWYEEGSVLTYYGLVSLAPPSAETSYLEVLSSFTTAAVDYPEDVLAAGYENCAAASVGDVDWWAEELRLLVEDSPSSTRTDDAFGYLAIVELAVSELCPQHAQTWTSTKSVLASEAWYPTRADFPNTPDQLAGLFG